jgi:hypothetical protein
VHTFFSFFFAGVRVWVRVSYMLRSATTRLGLFQGPHPLASYTLGEGMGVRVWWVCEDEGEGELYVEICYDVFRPISRA